MKNLTLLTIMVVITTTASFASSGRTNKDGCHTNRSTGVYHCH